MDNRDWVSKIACTILLVTGGLAFFWLVVLRIVAKYKGGEPCPYALAWLVDNPLRRRYMDNALGRIGIQPGERVLELGPGPGAFSVEAARQTEPGGTLIAVDIQPRMIATVEKKAREAGVTNIETHVASACDLPLESESVDRAFLVTVLPEIPDRHRTLLELHRVLMPGAMLSITEEFMDPDYPLAWTTIRWAEEAGFELAERHGNWFVYTLNFRKRG